MVWLSESGISNTFLLNKYTVLAEMLDLFICILLMWAKSFIYNLYLQLEKQFHYDEWCALFDKRLIICTTDNCSCTLFAYSCPLRSTRKYITVKCMVHFTPYRFRTINHVSVDRPVVEKERKTFHLKFTVLYVEMKEGTDQK